MVTVATKEMLDQCVKLWQTSFGDGDIYTDFVFGRLLTPEKILVYLNSKEIPIGMLCMEPMTLVSGEFSCPAVYMYAFSVHPRYRSRGVGARLLEGFHEYCKKEGYYASVLTPASKDLFDYYGSRGYKTQFAIRQLTLDPEVLLPTGRKTVLIPRALDTIGKMRNEFFGMSNLLVRWSDSYLKFVGEEAQLRGGEVLSTNVRGKKGYLVYRMEDDEAIITEFAVPSDCIDDVIYTLHQRVGAKRYKIRISADYPSREGGMVLPFAMIQWYDKMRIGLMPNAPYISHVMD